MADEETAKRRMLRDDQADPTLREAVLESLLQLHIDFRDLGCIADAGPLLHALMELAYHAGAEGSAAVSPPLQRTTTLN